MNALPGCATIIELDFVCCHNAGDHSPSARRRRFDKIQEAAEKAFDAQSNIVREAVADKNCQGLVVDISADYYNEGDTVPYIKNGSPLDVHLKGEFGIDN